MLCSMVPEYRRFENNLLNHFSVIYHADLHSHILTAKRTDRQTNRQTQCNIMELTDRLPVKIKGFRMKTCDYFRSKPEVLLKHELVELVGPVGTKPHPLWSSMAECTWFNVVRIMTQGWYWYVRLYDINATTRQQCHCRYTAIGLCSMGSGLMVSIDCQQIPSKSVKHKIIRTN